MYIKLHSEYLNMTKYYYDTTNNNFVQEELFSEYEIIKDKHIIKDLLMIKENRILLNDYIDWEK
jgi:hypothetical protein